MRKSQLTLVFIVLLLLVMGLSVSFTDHHMTQTDKNKEMVKSFYEEVFNQHNAQNAEKFIAKDAVSHASPPEAPKGLEGAKQLFGMYFLAFPDMKITVEDMIAEGDKVVSRYTMTGTHKGEFMGIAATNKKFTTTGIEILRIADGKFVEHWAASDDLGMMQQLGVIPMPSAAETVTLAVTGMA